MQKTVTKVTPGNSSPIAVVGNDPQRTNFTVQNVGAVNVALGGSAVTYATGIPLAPNQQLECAGDTDALYAIAQSSTGDLRIIAYSGESETPSTALPKWSITRLNVAGATNGAPANTIPMSDGTNLVQGNVLFYMLTGAITPNSTTTTSAAGSLAITSHATGQGIIFVSDGSKWQLMTIADELALQSDSVTVATTGTTSAYVIAPEAGILNSVDFSCVDALAQHASNYLTFAITNLGQSGGGSTAMLAATDANTTKTSTGTAIGANTKRSLTMHGTAANLVVAKGDRLEIDFVSAATLANTLTFAKCLLRFTRTA